jgi:hypothetical protein
MTFLHNVVLHVPALNAVPLESEHEVCLPLLSLQDRHKAHQS